MKKFRISFELSLNDSDPTEGHSKVSDWILGAIDENLLDGENVTEFRIEDCE